ncbi:flagellar biosynthetic protein FliO [Ornithinibacillus californiensis]|uniref:flagellar biosynthetic protein FliO n=1 Tax=Ornithinibacillus californiensis TaxID=161536 RepID=UPI00064DF097|nr:flagellar biosynthetic protein FliO [Ornithinibacillus californiensis]
MSKKSGLGILLGLVLFLIVSPTYVHADGDKVSDMFENNTQNTENSGTDSGTNTGENPPATEEEQSESGSVVFSLIQMVFALFLILILIYLLLKFLNKRNKLFNQVKALENLGGITVGPSKSIQVVRVGGKLYLIGVGENVQLLEEIIDEQMKEEILKSYQEQSDFKAENVLSFFQRKTNQVVDKENTKDQNFKSLFSNELEKLKQNRKHLVNKHTEKEDNYE